MMAPSPNPSHIAYSPLISGQPIQRDQPLQVVIDFAQESFQASIARSPVTAIGVCTTGLPPFGIDPEDTEAISKEEEVAVVVGQEDGGLWLFRSNVLKELSGTGDDSMDSGAQEVIVDDAATISTRRSLQLPIPPHSPTYLPGSPGYTRGSPALSRASSSSFLPTVMISPPVITKTLPGAASIAASTITGIDHSLPQARSRAASAASSMTGVSHVTSASHRSRVDFLPGRSSVDGDGSRATVAIHAAAPTTKHDSKEEKDIGNKLKERLRNAQKHSQTSETPDRLAALAALGRGNLTNLKGKSGDSTPLKGIAEAGEDMQRELSSTGTIIDKGAFEQKGKKAMALEKEIDDEAENEEILDAELDHVYSETEKVTEQRDKARETASLAGSLLPPLSPSNPSSNSRGQRAPVRIIPHSSAMRHPVALVALSKPGLMAVVSAKGAVAILDVANVVLGDVYDAQGASRAREGDTAELPDLSPALDWQSAEAFVHKEVEYIVLVGHPTELSLSAAVKPYTRVVFVELQASNHQPILRGKADLPGSGLVVTLTTDYPHTTLLHLTDNSILQYDLQVGPSTNPASPNPNHLGDNLHKSRSASNFTAMFSPAPSRPLSRAGSIMEGKEGGGGGGNLDVSMGGFAKLLGKRSKGISEAELARVNHAVMVLLDSKREVVKLGDAGWKGIKVVQDQQKCLVWQAKGLETYETELWSRRDTVEAADIQDVAWFSETPILLNQEQFQSKLHLPRAMSVTSVHGWKDKLVAIDHSSLKLFASNAHQVDWIRLSMSLGSRESRIARVLSVEDGGRRSVVVFDADGHASQSTLVDLLTKSDLPKTSRDLEQYEDISPVSTACTVTEPRTQALWVAAGGVDGCLRLWSSYPFRLVESISIFPDAIQSIVQPDTGNPNGPLDGKLLLLSAAGSVAVFDVVELELLYIIPGAKGGLKTMILKGDDIILPYSSGKARVWNLSTLEFRRSTATDAAEDMLVNELWEYLIDPETENNSPTSIAMELTTLDSWSDPSNALLDRLINLILDCKGIKFGKEDVFAPAACASGVGLQQRTCTVLPAAIVDNGGWSVSSHSTGMLSLFATALVRPMLAEADTEAKASQIITEVSAIIPTVLERNYVDVDLEFLAGLYNHNHLDVHHSARLLLEARLARLSDMQATELVDSQCGQLPVNVPKNASQGQKAFYAVLATGGLALRRFNLLSSTALKDIASSILLYLEKSVPGNQMLAIDYCHKGFEVWQNYVDPSDMLRALFALAVPKDSTSLNSAVAAHARVAVLHLAADAGPMFVTTLSMDIMDARTVEERDSVMRLCVFVARKKPKVLFPSVPRVAEAVVKSLDPTRVHMRESIQETATIILNELVKTYPTIDFAGKVQRLAVGTPEGAVIMYDLKTATRLYVVETHHHSVTALAFSPDGRRLVTVSIEEQKCTVWKVGSSFSSLFNIGGLPRQGSGAGEPFRTFDFALPQESLAIDPATGQQKVDISWPADRSVCLSVGLVKMTFVT